VLLAYDLNHKENLQIFKVKNMYRTCRSSSDYCSTKGNGTFFKTKNELTSDSTTVAAHRAALSVSSSSSSINTFEDNYDRDDFLSQHEDAVERLMFDGLELVLEGTRTLECHVSEYMSKREMTSFQEKINALTIIPNVVWCAYFLLSGSWLSEEEMERAGNSSETTTITDGQWLDLGRDGSVKSFQYDFFPTRCLSNPMFPKLYAMPPLPLLAIAFGLIVHAPFSFLYHWVYARRLPPGFSRINHWSRRLDHAFIHVCIFLLSFGATGRWDVFWVNFVYTLDCVYRQFETNVRPGRNKIRILIALFLCTLPILSSGNIALFLHVWTVLLIAGWFFVSYPIGGWSHSAFHVVLWLLPPVLMNGAIGLPASQAALKNAAKCAVSITN